MHGRDAAAAAAAAGHGGDDAYAGLVGVMVLQQERVLLWLLQHTRPQSSRGEGPMCAGLVR